MTRRKIARLPVPEPCRALMLAIHRAPRGQVARLRAALKMEVARALAAEKEGARQ